jgi:light-regulated signal transduction histidine kinase (bacteriophytochrome)
MVKVQGPESVNDNVIRGIRSRALKEEKIVIFNDPVNNPYWSGLPDGHYPINSFMGAPLIYRDKVIGLIALANKKEGYFKEDMKVMEVITTAITESLMHYRVLRQLEENQNELKETITELERSNQELESFAYITSHDLQEPLRTIASFTQLMERRYKGKFDSDADEFMDYIVIAAVRMKAMIQGLLDYSRVGKDEELNEFNAEEALNQTLSNMHSSIEECHAEITHENLPVIIADKKQIARVFQNLIGNALKFRKDDVKPKIHVSAEKIDNEYIFSVQDNGIGIEEQYMGRIFDVFKRLHTIDKYEGTGIGLSVVKRIIDHHGGRVWVESSLGVGSTFYFTIPMMNE